MIVKCYVHSEVCVASRFNCELVIIGLESCDKVVCIFLRSIFYAEVVHHETEGDVAGKVFKEAWRVGTLYVTVRLKVRDEAKLAETTGLRETVHALADFEVDGVVVEKRFKVVGYYSGGGKFCALDANILIAGGRKRSAKIKIFDINSKPFLAFGYSGLEQEFDYVQASGACGYVVRYVKKISACSAANPKLYSAVVVEFLFDNRIVINDVTKSVAGNSGVRDRDDRAGENKACDFFGFGGDPMDAIRSGFGGRVGKWLTMAIKVEGYSGFGYVVLVGWRWCGCVRVG